METFFKKVVSCEDLAHLSQPQGKGQAQFLTTGQINESINSQHQKSNGTQRVINYLFQLL